MQTNVIHVKVCNIVRNHANSEMPCVVTVSGKGHICLMCKALPSQIKWSKECEAEQLRKQF